MTITQTIEIPADRRITVPREVPTGKAQVIIKFPVLELETSPQEAQAPEPQKVPVFGCLKGQIWMADDFDAPLEDFKDYM